MKAVSRVEPNEVFDLELWTEEMFKGRSIGFGTFEGEILDSISIPDDLVLCDNCNEQITEFPVKVVMGRAYCNQCYDEWYETKE